MAPQSALASAGVNREAGRRSHRLGAFSLVRPTRAATYARPHAPPPRRRQRHRLRGRHALLGDRAARSRPQRHVRPVEARGRAARGRLRRRGRDRGYPLGLFASRIGPKRTVVVGLLVLAVSTLAFSLGESAVTLGVARFAQGVASAITWCGALAWLTLATPREQRGKLARHGVQRRRARLHHRARDRCDRRAGLR